MKTAIFIILLMLVGCSDNDANDVKRNISRHYTSFNYECKEISECMDAKSYFVRQNLTYKVPMVCEITLKEDDLILYFNIPDDTDVTKRPAVFGYLKSGLLLCEFFKEKGEFSKESKQKNKVFDECIAKKHDDLSEESIRRTCQKLAFGI